MIDDVPSSLKLAEAQYFLSGVISAIKQKVTRARCGSSNANFEVREIHVKNNTYYLLQLHSNFSGLVETVVARDNINQCHEAIAVDKTIG